MKHGTMVHTRSMCPPLNLFDPEKGTRREFGSTAQFRAGFITNRKRQKQPPKNSDQRLLYKTYPTPIRSLFNLFFGHYSLFFQYSSVFLSTQYVLGGKLKV